MDRCTYCLGNLRAESAAPFDQDQRPELVCLLCARTCRRLGPEPTPENYTGLFANDRQVGRPRRVVAQ